MKQASLSVVIPTYNSGSLVVQAIESVLAQTVAPLEIIVVDDGSRDDTQNRLAPFANRIHYHFQKNQGVAAARNHGIQQSRGDLVAFLDADDVWHPRKIEIQTQIMAGSPKLALLGTSTFDWPGETLPEIANPFRYPVQIVPWNELVVKNYFTTSSVIAQRKFLEQVGPFDTELQGAEDHDLWLRIAEVAAVANLKAPLTGYRSVIGSLSQQPVTMEAGMQRILEKLDKKNAWNGRPMLDRFILRQRAFSYASFSAAMIYKDAGARIPSLARLLRSFLLWPLPYHPREVRKSLVRLRMFMLLILGILGLRKNKRKGFPANILDRSKRQIKADILISGRHPLENLLDQTAD